MVNQFPMCTAIQDAQALVGSSLSARDAGCEIFWHVVSQEELSTKDDANLGRGNMTVFSANF